ncbi:MAG: fructosamine kinase family protein [Methylocystaceae bacterium]|nr:fructosamine kinase family protein [Methylocystaceae bacterium]
MDFLKNRIECIFNQPLMRVNRLSGGCIGDVFQLCLKDGQDLVAKYDPKGCQLGLEGKMLAYLACQTELIVPELYHHSDDLLVMQYLAHNGRLGKQGEEEAADALATLHQVKSSAYGFEFDTLIGGLHQPNTWCEDWFDFYAQHRLGYMADQAITAGYMNSTYRTRIEKLSLKLADIAPQPKHPSLVHGDLWAGNVLGDQGRLTGFIDPAIYFGHPEMDLAFSTLFNSFSPHFYARYQEQHPLEKDFFEDRVDLYNLYPLLVHVRLFGEAYVGDVDRILRKFGC